MPRSCQPPALQPLETHTHCPPDTPLRPQGLTLTPGEEGHCTRCYGCSVTLERLPSHDVVLGRERVVRSSSVAGCRQQSAQFGGETLGAWE